MEDLDALLEDLESAIPPPITCGPKPTHGNGHGEFIIEMQPEINGKLSSTDVNTNMSSLQGNLTELDSLLEDLYSTEDTPDQTEELSTDSKLEVSNSTEPAVDQLEKVNIDNMIDDFDTDNADDKEKVENDDNSEEKKTSSISVISATQELEDLMISLAGFNDENNSTDETKTSETHEKVKKTSSNKSKDELIEKNLPSPPSDVFAPIPMPANLNDLDVMLEDMNSVLVQQGIVAASKGLCGACQKPVMGEVTTAFGLVWHPEHFVCAVCDQEIGSRTFFERERKPYCEDCYHKLFSPTCAYCKLPVLGQCVTALNDTWHPEHFFCAACNNFFGDEGFHEHDGKPYCRADFYKLFAPHCGGCKKPIISNYISALNAQWHPECFVCGECLAPFTNGSFFELSGLPYCEIHYHSLRGSLCAECQKPITGRCITAMGKKFHPEHFVCAFCLKQLNKGTFKEQNGKPYCYQCFAKLFTQPGSV